MNNEGIIPLAYVAVHTSMRKKTMIPSNLNSDDINCMGN